jgi:hypothetical protein
VSEALADDAIARDYGEINPDMTDHEVAEAIRDKRVASPQKMGDFWLFALRITGTGAAYRDSLEEWAFRDPSLWLTDEFVARCAGLAVIFGHPERSGLNHEEYRERAIGNIVLPYRLGDEVWGIAKIFDADAATLMQTTHRSTSPGVTPPKGSLAAETNDGDKVLAEGLPLILDHLAVCELGVWDKDGPPDGIRLDSRDSRKDASSVTEAEKAELEKERDDARARADAAEKELADAKARMDAMKADAGKKDGEGEYMDKKDGETEEEARALAAAEKAKEDKAKSDAKRDARKDRHAKHDADMDIMDCAKCDSEEEEERKKDAAMAPKTEVEANKGTDIVKDSKLQRELDDLRARFDAMNREPSIADANAIAAAWDKWDPLYQALGDRSPRHYPGEKPRAYMRRLADGVRKYTTSWKEYTFHDSQHPQDFAAVSELIYAEALAHARKPVADKPGFLREIVTTQHGKTRTEFVGDAKAPWLAFQHPTRVRVVSLTRPAGAV